jgi:basic membrane protein A
MAVPAVQAFGAGYALGAYQAAKDLSKTGVEFKSENFYYANVFQPSEEVTTKATTMYSSGVEAIHAAAGGAGESVMKAAKDLTTGTTKKWVVGVDSDQKESSPTVITSALKGVGQAAYDALDALFTDKWATIGGKKEIKTVKDDAVGIPTDYSRFDSPETVKTAVEATIAKIKAGTLVIPSYDKADYVTYVNSNGLSLPLGLLDTAFTAPAAA